MKKELSLKIYKRNITKAHKLLQKQLRIYNVKKIDKCKRKQIVFGYYKGKKLIAGLYACNVCGILHIDLLWVDKPYRHKGLGSNLLKMAESYAIKNKALYARVNTGSFQAPKFYSKQGYKQFAKLPIIADTKQKHYDYYFVKYFKVRTNSIKKA